LVNRYKMDSHDLYEVIRAAMDPDEKRKAWDQHCANASAIPVPEGVLEIPKPKSYSLPCDQRMYAELAVSRAMKLGDALVPKCAELTGVTPEAVLMSVSEVEAMLTAMVEEGDLDGGDGPDDESAELKVAVNRLPDVLKLTFTLPTETYTQAAKETAVKLRGAGFTEQGMRNGWTTLSDRSYAGGTLGLRLLLSTKGAGDDGVAFTDDSCVPFVAVLATAESAAAEAGLVECWETRKTKAARADFAQRMAALRAKVPTPEGATTLA